MADQPRLQTVVFPVEDLTRYYKNARKGDVEAIASSLDDLDQFRTIVVNKGTHTGRPNEVLAGNHTLDAAKFLGWDTIEATVLDVDETTAAKIVAADNRTNDLATYDNDALADLLEHIGRDNLAGTGYTSDDYDGLVEDLDLPEPLDTGGTGVGTGESASSDSLAWGFVGWSTTRVRITGDETRALDDLYESYVEERGSAAGFGHFLAGLVEKADEQAAAVLRAQGHDLDTDDEDAVDAADAADDAEVQA